MSDENSKNNIPQENEQIPDERYETETTDEVRVEIEKLKKKIKECREEKEKYLTGWQRSQADFINYRRRQEEQMAEWSKMLDGGLIKDILPVMDSLDAAQKSQPDNQGLTTLAKQFEDILKKHGLAEIKSIGEKFNPEFHEVVECQECEEGKKHEEGIVTEEIQKGYILNGKVIRVAKVGVIKK